MSKKKTVVINIIGAPGSGKSTFASKLFYEMKIRNFDVELIGEYAKELVREERHATFDDELYIFAKQNHRIFRCNGKVDYIITDSPIIQKLYYQPKELDFKHLVVDTHNMYENFNIFLARDLETYETNGRNQTKEESAHIQNELKTLLNTYDILYNLHDGMLTDDQIVQHIILALEARKK